MIRNNDYLTLTLTTLTACALTLFGVVNEVPNIGTPIDACVKNVEVPITGAPRNTIGVSTR